MTRLALWLLVLNEIRRIAVVTTIIIAWIKAHRH